MNNNNLKIGLLILTSPEIKGVGPAFIRKHITTENYFSSNIESQLALLLNENKKQISEDIIYQVSEDAKQIISRCKDENIQILTMFDSAYPNTLKQLKDAPSVIFIKGNTNILTANTVCIIGTREPNNNGVRITQRVAEHYRKVKWNICNGLAEGIDTAAIQLNNEYYSNVIGIVAGGLNYNSQKTLLRKTSINAEKVLEAGGVIISEFPPDKKEDTFSVVKSCRLQAGISDGLFLIQSSLNGGSKFTLKSFCETNRPIAVINPLKEDENMPSYSANIIIRDKKIDGLIKITDLKSEKIFTKDIILINSKTDYATFDNLIITKGSYIPTNKTLFD